jgi:hypothetical protein
VPGGDDVVHLIAESGFFAWSGIAWSGIAWSGIAWSGIAWSGIAWSGVVWSGLIVWSGVVWSGVAWSGVAWSGVAWSGVAWSGLTAESGLLLHARSISLDIKTVVPVDRCLVVILTSRENGGCDVESGSVPAVRR